MLVTNIDGCNWLEAKMIRYFVFILVSLQKSTYILFVIKPLTSNETIQFKYIDGYAVQNTCQGKKIVCLYSR